MGLDLAKMYDSLKNMIAPVRDDMYEEDETQEAEEAQVTATTYSTQEVSSSKVVNGEPLTTFQGSTKNRFGRDNLTLINTSAKAMNIQIYTPQNFDDVSGIADSLKEKKCAIVNYEKLEIAEQRRLCDFLNGVCYVQDGEVRRITNTMVLYVPVGVDINDAQPVPKKDLL